MILVSFERVFDHKVRVTQSDIEPDLQMHIYIVKMHVFSYLILISPFCFRMQSCY